MLTKTLQEIIYWMKVYIAHAYKWIHIIINQNFSFFPSGCKTFILRLVFVQINSPMSWFLLYFDMTSVINWTQILLTWIFHLHIHATVLHIYLTFPNSMYGSPQYTQFRSVLNSYKILVTYKYAIFYAKDLAH